MKRRHRRAAWELFKSLLESEIVSIEDAPEGGRRIVLGEDLQDSFSLNQTLSLFLVHALDLFDPESETHALDVVSLAESILEDPWHVLAQQVEKLKTEKLAELKAAGVEYEERMAELEKIEHPKPLADVLYGAYDGFAGHYPWAKQQPIRPKSIARDMFEQFASFAEYVKTYGLQRSEGVLLRYLSDCYRVLTQNVPERRRTEALDDVIAYVREVLRTVDSSLLDEWERMRDPARLEAMARAAERGEDVREAEAQATTRASDITARPEDFERMVRTGAFHVVRALSRHDFEEALDVVAAAGTDDQAWTPQRLEEALRPYFAEYTVLRIDNEARNKRHGRILERQPDRWVFEQAMLDAEDVTDWVLRFIVDVAASRREQRVVLQIESLRALG